MKRRYKIINGCFVLLAISVLFGALVLSHDSPCGTAPALPAGTLHVATPGVIY